MYGRLMALCGCGCGEEAGVYMSSNSAAGIVKGQPKQFIHGHHNRLQPTGPRTPIASRYDVDTATGCWIWRNVGAGDDGYGRCWVDGHHEKAHRVMYEQANGPVPPSAQLDHLCRNRACVNPDHLEVVTHAENCRRGANAKLRPEQVDEIRRRRSAGELGVRLAAEFGVSPQAISMIHRRHVWVESS